jgi:formylglycine-generating enzyme required for sulfatase activity
VRGGSWGMDPNYCRAAYRGGLEAGARRNCDLGFRVVLRPGPSTP